MDQIDSVVIGAGDMGERQDATDTHPDRQRRVN